MSLQAFLAERIAQVQVWRNVRADPQRIGIRRGCSGPDPFVKMVAEDLPGGSRAIGRFGVNAPAPALWVESKGG